MSKEKDIAIIEKQIKDCRKMIIFFIQKDNRQEVRYLKSLLADCQTLLQELKEGDKNGRT